MEIKLEKCDVSFSFITGRNYLMTFHLDSKIPTGKYFFNGETFECRPNKNLRITIEGVKQHCIRIPHEVRGSKLNNSPKTRMQVNEFNNQLKTFIESITGGSLEPYQVEMLKMFKPDETHRENTDESVNVFRIGRLVGDEVKFEDVDLEEFSRYMTKDVRIENSNTYGGFNETEQIEKVAKEMFDIRNAAFPTDDWLNISEPTRESYRAIARQFSSPKSEVVRELTEQVVEHQKSEELLLNVITEIGELFELKVGEDCGVNGLSRHIFEKLRHMKSELDTHKRLISKHGVCVECGDLYEFHGDEPFASCSCGTSDWVAQLTPHMKTVNRANKRRDELKKINITLRNHLFIALDLMGELPNDRKYTDKEVFFKITTLRDEDVKFRENQPASKQIKKDANSFRELRKFMINNLDMKCGEFRNKCVSENPEPLVSLIKKHPDLHDLITHLNDFKTAIEVREVISRTIEDKGDQAYWTRQLDTVNKLIETTSV